MNRRSFVAGLVALAIVPRNSFGAKLRAAITRDPFPSRDDSARVQGYIDRGERLPPDDYVIRTTIETNDRSVLVENCRFYSFADPMIRFGQATRGYFSHNSITRLTRVQAIRLA